MGAQLGQCDLFDTIMTESKVVAQFGSCEPPSIAGHNNAVAIMQGRSNLPLEGAPLSRCAQL